METKRAIDAKRELAIEQISNYKTSADAMGENLTDYLNRIIWDLVWNGSPGWNAIDDELLPSIYEDEMGVPIKLHPLTDAEIELKEKRYALAERELDSMDSAELIDLLLTAVYNKMSDDAVIELSEEIILTAKS
tara:strand:- start:18 stop:419 length:402 start_codon:yes stop_codon:yes gene_type:complete